MVADRTNHYYTRLLEALQAEWAGVDGGQERNDSPASFPYVHFAQIDGAGVLYDLTENETGVNLTYEVQLYSKKLSEARGMANAVREAMLGLGFRCIYFRPEDNVSDASIKRFVARFSKIETG